MRNNTQMGLIAVIVLLLGGSAFLFAKYRQTSTDYANVKVSEQNTKQQYTDAINEIAAIQDSLNAIGLGGPEGGLNSNLDQERRLRESRGDAALARIEELKAGIERAKDRIATLESNLKKSGVKVSGLQRMITNLNKEVASKETEIAALTTQVDSLQTTVTGLVAEVQVNQDSIRSQQTVIEDKTRELGTIYYTMGSKKELKESGVVVSKGGVLGIGKTLEPSLHINEALLTPLDTDEQTVITIPAKKVEILTAQPALSYELRPVGDAVELHIIDPVSFRKIKHLVIMTPA
jgi:uncharacterized coiled-coil protein SlyX